MVSVVLFACVLTVGVIWMLEHMNATDEPNDRSNHAQATLTGGGLGFMLAILSFLTVVSAPGGIIVGALMLMGISFYDDLRNLPITWRLGAQLVAVLIGLVSLPDPLLGGFLPSWMAWLAMIPLWLWLINLTNFMDGIDEMTISEFVPLCMAIMAFGLMTETVSTALGIDAMVIGLAVASFYPWNKHPARCFMGDTGSVPLGFLLGYLLFGLVSAGAWALALILPAYYLTDATLTLLHRLLQGEAIWRAHSRHCYQRAVRSGKSHRWVTRQVLALNVMLAVIGYGALQMPDNAYIAVGAAYALAILLCIYFAAHKPNPTALQSA